MNERLHELMMEATKDMPHGYYWPGEYVEKFAELIVQGCADFVRENYDHEAAESIAWCMEINYGLHGDYA